MTETKKNGPTPLELLADTPMLLSNSKESGKAAEVPTSSCVEPDSTVCFYFSASWCPPCVRFTPELVKVYEGLRAEGKKVAICFVSLDRENSSFEGYFKKMPWFAIPRTDPTIRSLTSLFQVNSIPKLVVVGSDGAVLNHNAVQSVSQLGSAGFPWKVEAGAVGSLSYEPLASFAFTIVIVLLVLFLPYLDQIRSKLGI